MPKRKNKSEHRCKRWWTRGLMCPFRKEEEHEEDDPDSEEGEVASTVAVADKVAAVSKAGKKAKGPGAWWLHPQPGFPDKPGEVPLKVFEEVVGAIELSDADDVSAVAGGEQVIDADEIQKGIEQYWPGIIQPKVPVKIKAKVKKPKAAAKAIAKQSLSKIMALKQNNNATTAVAEETVASSQMPAADIARFVAQITQPKADISVVATPWAVVAVVAAAAAVMGHSGQMFGGGAPLLQFPSSGVGFDKKDVITPDTMGAFLEAG